MTRHFSPELDIMLGTKFPVLDDGFIRPVDYMGSDASVVQAARVAYGDGTKSVSDDRTLIRYLMRNHHSTPFEMANIKFHLRVPMDTWRQWIRHRTGKTSSVNEYSTRYSIAIDAMQKTAPNEWRLQSKDNKQGSDGWVTPLAGEALSLAEHMLHQDARKVYEDRLAAGVAREQARKDLPLSTYTEAYWSMDLRNLLGFLELRLASDAQKEIRAYANAIANVVRVWAPMTWEAFVDYRLEAMTLSRGEVQMVRATMQALLSQPIDAPPDEMVLSKREVVEALGKLERFGFSLTADASLDSMLEASKASR